MDSLQAQTTHTRRRCATCVAPGELIQSTHRPYYPGDDQVDWNGISLYYKGPDFQNINQAQVPGFVYDVLHGYDPYNVSPSGHVATTTAIHDCLSHSLRMVRYRLTITPTIVQTSLRRRACSRKLALLTMQMLPR